MIGPETLARIKTIRQGTHSTDVRIRPIKKRLHRIQRILGLARINHYLSLFSHWVLLLAGIALIMLSSEQLRYRITEFVAAACVISGFIAAPILSILAWIGMLVPATLPLHHFSTALFIIAIVWLALAFASAHLHHSRQSN